MNKKIFLVSFTFYICISFILFYQHKTKINKKVITVGVHAEYQPFTWKEKNSIVGLDIDIIHEIGMRLDKKIKIIDMAFNMLIPKTQNGQIDIIASGITPTKDRAQQVFFTKPYIEDDPLLIITTKKNRVTTPEQLQGKKVVVNEGYRSDFWVSQQPHITIIRVNTITLAFLTLINEHVDAFVSSSLSVAPFFIQHGKNKFNTAIIEDISDSYALAVSKKKPKLYQKIEKTLEQMKTDGTLKKLKQKYCNFAK